MKVKDLKKKASDERDRSIGMVVNQSAVFTEVLDLDSLIRK